MRLTFFIKSIAVLAVSFLTGCSHHGAGALIGSWSADSGQKFVIQTNGTFIMTIPPRDLNTNAHYFTNINGTYTIIDSTHIKMTYQIWNGQFKGVSTNRFSVSDDEMSFQSVGSETITKFHRTKD
jgi:hypothetical protein